MQFLLIPLPSYLDQQKLHRLPHPSHDSQIERIATQATLPTIVAHQETDQSVSIIQQLHPSQFK